MSVGMTTSFSTVIVTRNRPAALALSLPLHLTQSRLPERILIIDSSDDISENGALIERLASTTSVPLDYQASAPGMTVQRNIGLAQVTSDVTFFPDDDSLVHPEALARMMHIYDRDTRGQIGGVCAIESATPPQGVLYGKCAVYQKRTADRIRSRIAPLRTRLEDVIFPDPMKLVARRLQSGLPRPEDWLAAENAVWVEWMTGFRMSFRTAIAQQVGFNETLGHYALYEDIDAGLGVLAGGHSLVASQDARIYHHKAPENRTVGRQIGVINILNRAYVVLRSGVVDDRIVGHLKRHARFRIAQFGFGSQTPYGKERLAGAKAAYNALPELLTSPPNNLDEIYRKLRQTCLEHPIYP
jgi:hypothetical protein